jgi:hypothetical protein
MHHWSTDVRHWWDGFHTRVHADMHARVPTSTSHRARRLRLMLPEARSGWCLSTVGSPRACGGPGPSPGHWVRQTGGEIPSARANHRVGKWLHGSLPWLVLFRLVGSSLQPRKVWLFLGMGCFVPQPYVAGGSQSYLGILGRNQRPAVPGVNYPDIGCYEFKNPTSRGHCGYPSREAEGSSPR